MERAGRTAVVVAVVLAVVAAATGVFAAVQTVRLNRAQAQQEELERTLAAARDRLEERGPGSTQDAAESPADEGLPGDTGVDELLDGLLGGDGSLGDAGALAACATDPELGRLAIDDSDGAVQYGDIADAVEQVRNLDFSDDVEPTYLTPEEISERITEVVTDEYSREEADIDRRVLATLGAIDADLDLRRTQIELLGDQIAGFYDSDTGEMVVATSDPGDPLGPTDQVTLAHELTHALTDQAVGLPDVLDEESPDSDAALAALALVEGDATLSMQRFAGAALDMGEQLGLAVDPRAAGAQAQLSQFPHVLQRQLVFPYEAGLRYVCALYSDGGWDAIDAAYDDLPSTTAEVLFPARAGDSPPVPEPPAAPDGDWQEARTDSLGAAELTWLFEAPGDDESVALSEPLERVARWDGGVLRLWTDGDASALGVVLREREGGGPALCDSVASWYDVAFTDDDAVATAGDEVLATVGPDQSAVVACTDGQVRLGVAPGLETARDIAR